MKSFKTLVTQFTILGLGNPKFEKYSKPKTRLYDLYSKIALFFLIFWCAQNTSRLLLEPLSVETFAETLLNSASSLECFIKNVNFKLFHTDIKKIIEQLNLNSKFVEDEDSRKIKRKIDKFIRYT